MTPKQGIRRRIVEIGDTLVELSRKIHAHPELGFEELRASAWLASALERAGFGVELDVFGMPTAFTAHAGTGSLHLALCAEYDALRFIFDSYKLDLQKAASRPALIAEHFAKVSAALGYSVRPPERFVDRLAGFDTSTTVAMQASSSATKLVGWP
jgi:hypothetical protein